MKVMILLIIFALVTDCYSEKFATVDMAEIANHSLQSDVLAQDSLKHEVKKAAKEAKQEINDDKVLEKDHHESHVVTKKEVKKAAKEAKQKVKDDESREKDHHDPDVALKKEVKNRTKMVNSKVNSALKLQRHEVVNKIAKNLKKIASPNKLNSHEKKIVANPIFNRKPQFYYHQYLEERARPRNKNMPLKEQYQRERRLREENFDYQRQIRELKQKMTLSVNEERHKLLNMENGYSDMEVEERGDIRKDNQRETAIKFQINHDIMWRSYYQQRLKENSTSLNTALPDEREALKKLIEFDKERIKYYIDSANDQYSLLTRWILQGRESHENYDRDMNRLGIRIARQNVKIDQQRSNTLMKIHQIQEKDKEIEQELKADEAEEDVRRKAVLVERKIADQGTWIARNAEKSRIKLSETEGNSEKAKAAQDKAKAKAKVNKRKANDKAKKTKAAADKMKNKKAETKINKKDGRIKKVMSGFQTRLKKIAMQIKKEKTLKKKDVKLRDKSMKLIKRLDKNLNKKGMKMTKLLLRLKAKMALFKENALKLANKKGRKSMLTADGTAYDKVNELVKNDENTLKKITAKGKKSGKSSKKSPSSKKKEKKEEKEVKEVKKLTAQQESVADQSIRLLAKKQNNNLAETPTIQKLMEAQQEKVLADESLDRLGVFSDRLGRRKE